MPPTASYSTLSTFHPFPRLPIKLRLKIWTWAHFDESPRFISLTLTTPRPLRVATEHDCSLSPHISVAKHPIPELLHTCRESREILIPKYNSGFQILRGFSIGLGSESVASSWKPQSIPQSGSDIGVFWDPSKDSIFLDLKEMEEGEEQSVPQNSQGFQISSNTACTWHLPSFHQSSWQLLIAGIKTLVLRHDDFRAWTNPGSDSIMRHVAFRGVEKMEVILPDSWWQRGGFWVGSNESQEMKCKSLMRRKLEADGENSDVQLRLMFSSGEVFDEVVAY